MFYRYTCSRKFCIELCVIAIFTAAFVTLILPKAIPMAKYSLSEDGRLMLKYKHFFYSRYTNDDMVYIADITHDGVLDMLAITIVDDYRYDCTVFSCSTDREIYAVYQESGGADHVGGLYNLFVCETEEGYTNLGKIGYGMWQGRGRLDFIEYYPDADSNDLSAVQIVDYMEISTDDAESVDSDGVVTDDAYQAFANRINQRLTEGGFSIVCLSFDEFGYGCPSAEVFPQKVFNVRICFLCENILTSIMDHDILKKGWRGYE